MGVASFHAPAAGDDVIDGAVTSSQRRLELERMQDGDDERIFALAQRLKQLVSSLLLLESGSMA